MSTLLDRIKEDWKQARIAGAKGDAAATARAATLGALIGEVQTKQKRAEIGKPWVDADTLALVKAGVENAKLTADALRKTDRVDDLAKAEAEIALLSAYMPQQMSEAEIETFVREKVAAGVSAMGALMGALKAERGGQYDGKLASAVVKRVLG